MALYKYNGVLLKSKESILLKEKEVFVKLSYFNNYTNSIDTPVYGEPYTIENNGHLIKNTMVINDITYPSLKLYGSGYSGKIPIGLDFLSKLNSKLLALLLSGKYLKNPIKFATTIHFLPLLILLRVSNLFIFKSGEIAIATLVKKSSIGNK